MFNTKSLSGTTLRKPIRWWTKEEGCYVIHDCPSLAASSSSSVEYGSTLEDIRKVYSGFRLLQADAVEGEEAA